MFFSVPAVKERTELGITKIFVGNQYLLITPTHHQHLVNLSLFESVDGDPGFVGADCPCMCSLYADCENYGASASAPVEKAPGM